MESRRFGRLTVTPERLVEFPAGLIGFEELREYLMVEETAWMPLRFLVACDDPELAFPVLPAPLCAPDYAPTFPAEAFGLIGALGGEPLEVLAVCTLAADTQTLHANLQGPILLNPATRLGCQVVLHDSPYSLRHLLGAV
jgi:flagellar assembly factor FliW